MRLHLWRVAHAAASLGCQTPLIRLGRNILMVSTFFASSAFIGCTGVLTYADPNAGLRL